MHHTVPPEAETTLHSMFRHVICPRILADSPQSDAIYPDTASGGYKKHDCGIYAPPAVISTSYGSNEADLTPAYEQRQCNELDLPVLVVTRFQS